jgi:hypothetical protein
MLYTIIPLEEVFAAPPWAAGGGDSAGAPPLPIPAVVGGVQVLVSPSYDGRNRVERVISTDPAVYLDPRFAPGTLI